MSKEDQDRIDGHSPRHLKDKRGLFAKRPAPDDFQTLAPTMTCSEIMRHYRVSWPNVKRWCRQLGVTPKPQARFEHPVPVDFKAMAAKMHVNGLKRHYGHNDRLIRRWLKVAGVEARPFNASDATKKQWEEKPIRPRAAKPRNRGKQAEGMRRPVKGRVVFPVRPRQAPRDASTVGDAADYLKRWFVPVYRCNERGNLVQTTNPTHFRIGNAIVSTEEMLERARRKGWNPHAWMELQA